MHLLSTNQFKITPNSPNRSLRYISHALAERKAVQAQINKHNRNRRIQNSRSNEVKFKMSKQEIGSSSYPIPAEILDYLYPSRVSCLSTFPMYSKYS